MDERERKRFVKLLFLAYFLLLMLVFGIVVYASLQVKDLHQQDRSHSRQIGLNAESIKQLRIVVDQLAERAKIPGPTGPIGPAGQNGLNGQDGRDGKDSLSTATHTVIERQTTIVEQQPIKGEKGDQGEPGAPGREIELRRNASTQEIEWRYVGTSIWMPLESRDE